MRQTQKEPLLQQSERSTAQAGLGRAGVLRRSRSALLLVLLAFGSVALAGCAGGIRPTTWTGLVVAEDIVYAADLEQVRALDAASGAVLWSFPAEPDLRQYGPFYTVTLLDHETLFVTSHERTGGGLFARSQGVLRALSIDEGREQWVFKGAGGEFVAGGAVGDQTLVIGNSDGKVYALRVEDGSPAWAQPFATGGRVWAPPLVLSDTAYVASLDHHLYALDLATGRERWRFRAGGALADRPLVLGDTLYIGAFDHHLYALRLTDGSEVWRFAGQNWFWGAPTGDGTHLYAADVNGNVYAIAPDSGDPVWQSQVGQSVRLGPALSPDGKMLLVAGEAGTLFGLDTSDGFVLWSQPGEGSVASMAVNGDIVYLARINAPQRIQAFYIQNGRPLWVYPQPEAEQ